MALSHRAWRAPFKSSRLIYRTHFKMASTIVGKSGRVYTQGEVLQRHRENPNFNVFKAEYVAVDSILLAPLQYLSDPSRSGPTTSPLSSSVYTSHSSISPFALRQSVRALIGCACTSTATRSRVSWSTHTSEALYLP
jgi:hypothetical protein